MMLAGVYDQENVAQNALDAIPTAPAKPERNASSVKAPSAAAHLSPPLCAKELSESLSNALNAAIDARISNPCSFMARHLRENAGLGEGGALPVYPPNTDEVSLSLSVTEYLESTGVQEALAAAVQALKQAHACGGVSNPHEFLAEQLNPVLIDLSPQQQQQQDLVNVLDAVPQGHLENRRLSLAPLAKPDKLPLKGEGDASGRTAALCALALAAASVAALRLWKLR